MEKSRFRNLLPFQVEVAFLKTEEPLKVQVNCKKGICGAIMVSELKDFCGKN